jgi:hypothetical protein
MKRRLRYRHSQDLGSLAITELVLFESAVIGSMALLCHIFVTWSWGMDWLAGLCACLFVPALAFWLIVKSVSGDLKVVHHESTQLVVSGLHSVSAIEPRRVEVPRVERRVASGWRRPSPGVRAAQAVYLENVRAANAAARRPAPGRLALSATPEADPSSLTATLNRAGIYSIEVQP